MYDVCTPFPCSHRETARFEGTPQDGKGVGQTLVRFQSPQCAARRLGRLLLCATGVGDAWPAGFSERRDLAAPLISNRRADARLTKGEDAARRLTDKRRAVLIETTRSSDARPVSPCPERPLLRRRKSETGDLLGKILAPRSWRSRGERSAAEGVRLILVESRHAPGTRCDYTD
ncbi:hypothetical protein TRVL_07585 [Trypanosoma vivax]|nr:hypothetical protein TRVL_07585 [Trypanosoma vivax]